MIKTERLHIIPLNYYELLSRVYSHTGMVMNEEHENNVVSYTINYMKEAPQKDHKFCTFWVGYDRGEEVVEVGFLRPPTQHGVLEIWCHTKPGFMNNGYGTEAIKGMTKWASCWDEVRHVCAGIDFDNYASQRMVTKAGFIYLTDMNNQKVYNYIIK